MSEKGTYTEPPKAPEAPKEAPREAPPAATPSPRAAMPVKKYDEVRGVLEKYPLHFVGMYDEDDKSVLWFVGHYSEEKLAPKLLQAVHATYRLLKEPGDPGEMAGFVGWLQHNGYITSPTSKLTGLVPIKT